MALHFSKDELAARRRRACRAMAERGLDGLVIFRQESMYYLTGYDTSGYSMFQGMYLGADGSFALCTRSADLRQARMTSVATERPVAIEVPRSPCTTFQNHRAYCTGSGLSKP